MKVVDLQSYRQKKEIDFLEKKINELVTAKELKVCFKEWLKKAGTLK